ncbi:hypothetical protein GQ464_002975 [Rhodocaloribacter litoris]|uniref:hypothetical protein n=1 Tax=Rhodocaloribacter litoris TaxID=2558931 RepID=UPI0014203448|nr:hypothetical protein [Rhodocaloribacter litoris]QXD15927.1 hypothetical protein GQ464_002975 [Rhodocaloribacter litoris]GIV60173.1 MAG: hypothetical protein KatS3mg043_1262 [Rhodothermaceae bacterium]
MEREQEIAKLVNVLRRAARTAMQAHWTGGDADAAAFCVRQYNRVLERLATLDPGVRAVFEPLPEDSSLTVAAMACRQLAAYYEDEVDEPSAWGRVYGAAFDADAFKTFWQRCAGDIEDLGEYIRESIESWARERKRSHHRAHTRRDDTPEEPPA